MNTNCKFNLRLVSYVLLISLFLQSCGTFSSQLTPKDKEPTNSIPLLEGQEFTVSGGNLVTFYQQDGTLQADIRVDEKQPNPNYKGLPVVLEDGTDLINLQKWDRIIQQRHIHFQAPINGQPGRVLVLQGGVRGGMMKGGIDSQNKGVFQHLTSLARDGDIQAQFKLGVMYYNLWENQGKEKWLEQAIKWLTAAKDYDDANKFLDQIYASQEKLMLPSLVNKPEYVENKSSKQPSIVQQDRNEHELQVKSSLIKTFTPSTLKQLAMNKSSELLCSKSLEEIDNILSQTKLTNNQNSFPSELADELKQAISLQQKVSLEKEEKVETIIINQKTYTLFKNITRKRAQDIYQTTGLEISFPLCEQVLQDFILGKGKYGKVYIAQQSNQAYVAIKIVQGIKVVEEEARIQASLANLPHLMPALDTWEYGHGKEAFLYQVMPLAGLGNLKNIDLTTLDPAFKEQILTYLATQMLRGLASMHQKGFFHGDFKADNLVLEKDANLRIIDFGFSEKCNRLYDVTKKKQLYGGHVSPERHLGANKHVKPKHDPKKFDSWSVGVTLLRLAKGGENPFRYDLIQIKCNSYEHYKKIIKTIPELNNPVEGSIWQIIRNLLAPKPKHRPIPSEVLTKYNCFKQQIPQAVQAYLKELVEHQRRDNFTANESAIVNLLPLPDFAKYVNRLELEKEIINSLTDPSNILTVCQGPGGVGKSQLVKYIIHQKEVKGYFKDIYWFSSADSPNQLQDQVILLAIDLRLIGREDAAKLSFKKIRRILLSYLEKKQGPILIVFDNADEPNSLEDYLAKGKTSQIHRLITTREPSWPNIIKIAKLHPNQSQTLIEKLLLHTDPQADSLAKFLDHLPLGITHGCAYIRQEKLSIDEFIKEIQENANVLKENPKLFGKDLPHTIASLWQATFRKLEEKYPTAFLVLKSLSLCDAERIPAELLEGLFNEFDSLATNEVRQALISYQLLEEKALQGYAKIHKGLSMHRLLQQVLQTEYVEHANKSDGSNISQQEFLLPLLVVLDTYMPAIELDPDNTWEKGRLYAPSVESFLKKATQSLATSTFLANLLTRMQRYTAHMQNSYQESLEYANQALEMINALYTDNHPNIAGSLINLANVYSRLGQDEKALNYDQKAFEMYQILYTGNHPNLAMSLNNLGNVYSSLGQNQEALNCFRQAFEMYQVLYVGNHSDTASSLNNIGDVHFRLGESEEALKYHQQALKMRQALYKDNHPHIATSLNSLGNVYYRLAKNQKALKFYQQALEIRQALYTGNHPDLAILMDNLGNVYSCLGQNEIALKHHQEAFEMMQALYPDNHPVIAKAMNNLGSIYLDLEQNQKALKYYQQAFKMIQALYPGNHPDMANVLNNLGSIYKRLEEYQEALKYHQQALEMYQALYTGNNSDMANALHNLGNVYLDLEQNQKALKYYQQALVMRQALYKGNHPDIASSLNSLGIVYERLRQNQEALKYYQQALRMRKTLYRDNHPDIARSLNNLGGVYQVLGEYKKALEYYKQAIEIYRSLYPGNHPDMANSLNNLGNVYERLGEPQKALEYYQQALVMKQALHADNHPSVAISLNNLGIVYERLRQNQEALKYHQQALEMRQGLYNGNHPDIASSLNNLGRVHQVLGEYKKALEYYKQAIEIYRSLYENNIFHVVGPYYKIDLTASYYNLGSTYGALGEYQEALKYYGRVLRMYQILATNYS